MTGGGAGCRIGRRVGLRWSQPLGWEQLIPPFQLLAGPTHPPGPVNATSRLTSVRHPLGRLVQGVCNGLKEVMENATRTQLADHLAELLLPIQARAPFQLSIDLGLKFVWLLSLVCGCGFQRTA